MGTSSRAGGGGALSSGDRGRDVRQHWVGVGVTALAATAGSPTGLLVRLLKHVGPWSILMWRSMPYLIVMGIAWASLGSTRRRTAISRVQWTKGTVLACALLATQVRMHVLLQAFFFVGSTRLLRCSYRSEVNVTWPIFCSVRNTSTHTNTHCLSNPHMLKRKQFYVHHDLVDCISGGGVAHNGGQRIVRAAACTSVLRNR